MKRLLFLLFLLPSLAWGSDLGQEYARMNPYVLGAGVSAAGPQCTSGAADQSGGSAASQSVNTLRGQSFQFTSDSYLYSIVLDYYATSGATDNLTLCVGSAENMGADGTCANAIVCKTQEFTVGAGTGTLTFVFADKVNKFTASTQYYMVLRSADAIGIGWSYNTSGGYANGRKYSTTATDCNLTGHEDSSEDFSFTVNVCAD